MKKLTVQVRTEDSLEQILERCECPAWVIGRNRPQQITHVRIVNWYGDRAIEGTFDPASLRREDDGRLILRFRDAKMVRCRIGFDTRNPVRYVSG